MIYQNLVFFDSESNELNLIYNQDLNLWEGVSYLPKVSTGLYETLTLYILEKAQGELGEATYVTPISSGIDGKLEFELESGYDISEDIFLYSAIKKDGDFFIEKNTKQTGSLLNATVVSGTTQTGLNIVKSGTKKNPLICNLALNSEDEGYHTNVLSIYSNENNERLLIARIRIYGETEAEDERLNSLLQNIGMEFGNEDFFIFKESNVNELSPDHIILNQKRKELLLQASKIKPFIGTYKALLNAIDFYGYDKITLKEYWLNINEQSENFGKLKAVAVPNQDVIGFLADKNNNNELPNSNQKKTSRFSLVYRLNTTDGGVDEWDIPTVKESFDFAPDEVLIKLYGLKNKLQKSFLPLQSKIIDITGEGDYFSQFNQNVWSNQHNIKVQNAGHDVEFKRYPEHRQLFIEDLRKVDYRLTGINQVFPLDTTIDPISGISENQEVANSIDAFYSTYYDDELSTFNTIAGIPIGCPIVLNVESYKESWDDAEFTWMDASDTGDHLLNWNNWWHSGMYEVEWVISGPNNFLKTYRGPIDTYSKFPTTLPFAGDYSIELNIYDLYNFRSTLIKTEYINVKNKNVEVYGVYEKILNKLNWNSYKYAWDHTGSDWNTSAENVGEVQDIVSSFYLTLDRANYVNDATDGIEFSTVRRFVDANSITGFSETTGPYVWKELENHVWNDGADADWDMTRVGADLNSSFKMDLSGKTNGHFLYITQVNPVTNETITDTYSITSPYPTDNTDVGAYLLIANELQNLQPEDHPILSKFNFNAIGVDIDNDESTGYPQPGVTGYDRCDFILAVAEEPSRSYDYETVGFNNPLGGEIVQGSEIHFTSYNPNFNNLAVVSSHDEVKMLNHLTFSYDTTKMPGVVGYKWRLKNNTQNIEDIYYNNQWLTYLFKYKGDYEIQLELTDLNGNKNILNKNIIKIV